MLFTNRTLLPVALKAAAVAQLPVEHIYLINIGNEEPFTHSSIDHLTIDQLIKAAEDLPALNKVKWIGDQGAKQTAFLCYSSGTSGLPVSGS